MKDNVIIFPVNQPELEVLSFDDESSLTEFYQYLIDSEKELSFTEAISLLNEIDGCVKKKSDRYSFIIDKTNKRFKYVNENMEFVGFKEFTVEEMFDTDYILIRM